MKKMIVFSITSFLLIGCASMPKKSLELSKTPFEKAVKKINGIYKMPNPTNRAEITDAISEMMNKPRKWGGHFSTEEEYSLAIKIESDTELTLKVLQNGGEFLIKKVKYEKRGDYFFLKNHNVMRHNIPFLLGGLIILKVRLALDSDNNLIFDCVKEGYGAGLFIFWSGEPTTKYSEIFQRIK